MGLNNDADSSFSITINGKPIRVDQNTSIAAAMVMAGEPSRFSVRGAARAPFCGIGICMECRATVNGRLHQRTCQLSCAPGMEVVTG
ncbi:MAG: (2Fe-2S)-binding protein [Terracidiphilus sp.]